MADTAKKRGGGKAAKKLSEKQYQKSLKKLHVELVKLQQWVVAKGLRVCVVFEGREGAGKGGTIKAITERVSPRVFRVVALPAPTEREKSRMYVQRYMAYFPAAGEVVIFDRSWYNRAGVERVMGFATMDQVKHGFLRGPAGRFDDGTGQHRQRRSAAPRAGHGVGPRLRGRHHPRPGHPGAQGARRCRGVPAGGVHPDVIRSIENRAPVGA